MKLQWIATSLGIVVIALWCVSGKFAAPSPNFQRIGTVGQSESDEVTANRVFDSKRNGMEQDSETENSSTESIKDSMVSLTQYGGPDERNPTRVINGVHQNFAAQDEATWSQQRPIPWEVLGPGEFLGPIRPAFESNYRVRINDLLEMTFAVNRQMLNSPYRIQMGDELEINDANRPEISKQKQIVMDDGFISPLEIAQVHVAGKSIPQVTRILRESYRRAGTLEPTITVSVTRNNTALRDLLEAIQGQINANGSIKQVRVSPDGTIQLPIIGRVCVYGLTLDEVAREVNVRYSRHIYNLNVTPALLELAKKTVFVFGEVGQPGIVELEGPTTAMGAIAAAQGFLQGANRRQVVVLRRDSQWRMVATKLDLGGAALGKMPVPTDDVWLRPSDILIIPKQPIQRLAEFIDLYFTQTLFVMIPNQGVSLNFDQADIFGGGQ